MAIDGPDRLTGVPGLDRILGGRLPERGVVFVVGAPGTGKTVLVQQLAFAAAERGAQVLYFSGFSEPHERLIEHLRPFAFFEERWLADRVQLLSLSTVIEQGVDATTAEVLDVARQARARLVIIDGFAGLRALIHPENEAVRFIYRLGAQISLVPSLLVVVLEADPRATGLFAELATADIILDLYHEPATVGERRWLEIRKRRGAHAIPGRHAVTINDNGITCYPQFENIIPPPSVPFDATARVLFDLSALDEMLGGGLTRQTMTIIAGSLGSGKTLLGLQFLAAGVAHQEPGVFLGFEESAEQLLARADVHGLGLRRAVADNQVHLLVQPPIGLDPDILAHDLYEALRTSGARRLVVDSAVELDTAVGRERAFQYLAAVAALLRGQGVTTLLTYETPSALAADVEFTQSAIAVLAENLIVLQRILHRGELHRVLAVLKMRFSDHATTVREFRIDAQGLTMLGPWKELLTGTA